MAEPKIIPTSLVRKCHHADKDRLQTRQQNCLQLRLDQISSKGNAGAQNTTIDEIAMRRVHLFNDNIFGPVLCYFSPLTNFDLSIVGKALHRLPQNINAGISI